MIAPTLGRIVHFAYGNTIAPAIITHVYVGADGAAHKIDCTVFGRDATVFIPQVPYHGAPDGGAYQDRSWHWPPRD